MGKIVNKAELAEILGKSERTLTTWQKNGLPIASDGERGSSNFYDVEEVIEWMINREIRRLVGDSEDPEGAYDYEKERARLTHHQANKVALEEEILRGDLIPAETVAFVQGQMLAAFRAKLLGMPTKLAPRVQFLEGLPELESEIRESVYDALSELSEFDPSAFGARAVPEGDSGDSAAS